MNALKDNYAINFIFFFFVNPGNPEKNNSKRNLIPPTHTLLIRKKSVEYLLSVNCKTLPKYLLETELTSHCIDNVIQPKTDVP